MDANQVNNFFAANAKYFTAQQCRLTQSYAATS